MQRAVRLGRALLLLHCLLFRLAHGEAIFVEGTGLCSLATTEHSRSAGKTLYVELLLGGHLVSTGSGAVLRLNDIVPDRREVTADGKFEQVVADSATFRTLSIEVPRMPKIGSAETVYAASDLTLYFSAGAAAWVAHGNGVYAKKATGTVSLRMTSDETAEVILDLKLFTLPANPTSPVKSNERIVLSRVFEKLTYERLPESVRLKPDGVHCLPRPSVQRKNAD